MKPDDKPDDFKLPGALNYRHPKSTEPWWRLHAAAWILIACIAAGAALAVLIITTSIGH